MKILCLSDLHGHLPQIPAAAEVIVLAGDYMPGQDHQEEWVRFTLRPWLSEVSQRTVVVAVAGNHDAVFQRNIELAISLNWKYLQDAGFEYEGARFWGTPWTLQDFPMAFAADAAALKAAANKIPVGTDVLISHGPPFGVGDKNAEGLHIGSRELSVRIEAIRPRLVVCGHVHEAYGIYSLGSSTVVNASVVDVRRRMANPPIAVEFALSDRVLIPSRVDHLVTPSWRSPR
jgi:Icc-related predicted phosphoesterase